MVPPALRRYLPILDWGARYDRESFAADALAAVKIGRAHV